MIKRAGILLCGLIFFIHSQAQEFLGVRNSNYAGIQGAFLNPSSIAGSALPWDINAFSVGTLFDNNFFYVPKGKVPPLGFRKIVNGIVHEDLFYTHFNIQQPNKLYNIALSSEVIGPSFFKQIAKGQSIGFSFAIRSYINVHDVTGHLAQNTFTDFNEKDLWNREWHDQSAKINSAGWFEYGLHYAKIISTKKNRQWKAGASLNFLQGFGAAYAKNANLNYKVLDSVTVQVNSSSFDYGLTKYDSGRRAVSFDNLHHGPGISGSIGVTYTILGDPEHCGNQSSREKLNADNPRQYILRLGLSLIDFGSIRFNRNSHAYHFETSGAIYKAEPDDNSSGKGLNPTLRSIASQTDSNRTLITEHFNMALPSAISVQADWQFWKDFFLNATIIKGLGHGNRVGIVRPDQYSITPRYETNWFEASLPFSVIYYGRWQSRIGVAFRIGYIFFGGDAPASLLGLSDFERTDFYAGIHIFPLPFKKKHSDTNCPEGVLNH
ncbi:MAG: hypothetical protein C5B59_03445 [Bacteroidetes bacterium]|nr:MAG: hypothetical protein C5B59_03445 [Bacteroidota bacterium]